MIRATFLDHSGFLVELADVCLLFDWWKGALPPLPQKPLAVFVSHRHEDHFSPAVFSLADGTRPVRFVLGKDIRPTEKNRARWSLTDETLALCRFMGGNEHAEVFPGVTVETLLSTDEGVAFVVDACGRTVYHAGDLHWWHWEGEDPAWNRNMEVNFQRFLRPLEGRHIDLAMVPLDGRLEGAFDRGLAYFLAHTDTETVLPMHQWGRFSLTERFCALHPALAPRIRPVTAPGQTFTI